MEDEYVTGGSAPVRHVSGRPFDRDGRLTLARPCGKVLNHRSGENKRGDSEGCDLFNEDDHYREPFLVLS